MSLSVCVCVLGDQVAPCAGEVASIPLRDGDKIEAGDLLLRLK